jgi:hypothetical protein
VVKHVFSLTLTCDQLVHQLIDITALPQEIVVSAVQYLRGGRDRDKVFKRYFDSYRLTGILEERFTVQRWKSLPICLLFISQAISETESVAQIHRRYPVGITENYIASWMYNLV